MFLHSRPDEPRPIKAWLDGSILAIEAEVGGISGQRLIAQRGSTMITLAPNLKAWKKYNNIETRRRVIDLVALSSEIICINQDRKLIDESDRCIVRAGLLEATDRQLRHASTINLEIRQGVRRFCAEVCNTTIVSDITKDHVFEALLGCVGQGAILEVRVSTNAPSVHHRTYRVQFDLAFQGGSHVSNHKHVRIPLNIKAQKARISLHVISDDNGGTGPALELGPTVLSISNPVLREGKRKRNSRIESKPRMTLINTPKSPASSRLLFVGSVPPFTSYRDDPIFLLKKGTEVAELFSPERKHVWLIENYQHSFTLKANKASRFLLFANGEPVQFIDISTDETLIYLPAKLLRGEPVDVQIRDVSGSQIFLVIPLLPPRALTPEDVLLRVTRRPFPTDLTVRANFRYKALRAHLCQPIPGITPRMLFEVLETLDGNYNTVKLSPLSFPVVAEPQVSVVIPAHNRVEVTYYALSALLLAHNSTSFEVIVVDDGSNDETSNLEEWVSGITVIHNKEPQRFIKACNRGVREARGHYVALLNNDTEVTLGWLDALVDAFSRFENVGVVGAKLVYPDGRLQDAGGIIWGSGNPWNYGNGHNPWDPRFSYARQVDYISGAALMTPKKIWDQVGGLSEYLQPMYFEDTDFCFKVREAGYATYFVPSSVVYHFEGVSSGTDISKGFKKYQELNRPKFKRRWSRQFASHGREGMQPDLEKDRGIAGRILFIDYALPREDKDAGSYAAMREIELVQSLGYKVTFLPLNLASLGDYTDELQRRGVEVIVAPFYLSLHDYLEKHPEEFDVAYITRYGVARDSVHLLRESSPRTRIILNNADLHFLRELRAALSENNEERMERMRIIRNDELEIMQDVDLVLSYNEVEHAVISSHTEGKAKVMTCPWVVEVPAEVATLPSRQGLSFLGSFSHHPNVEGIQWFCLQIMPRLDMHRLKLSIYGADMDDTVKRLASEWIDPVGFIPDFSDAYQRHRVFIAPLLSGAGIKGKVLNALAYGVPTVLTPTAAEGIGLRDGYDCLIARTEDDWIEAIKRLCYDDELWMSISAAARAYVRSRFSFMAGRKQMKQILEAVDVFTCDQ
jgi:GT2 family glycosyltransferase/glycosyltransferase involved in cell wall biosynthesis